MNLCDGDCEAAAKIQELQQLVAGLEVVARSPTRKSVAESDDWFRVLELLDIPTF